jgi:hypothetical protein
MGRQPTRGQVAGALVAAAAVLGGGGAGGYFLHGGGEDHRDQEEHTQFAQALRDCTSTNLALRDAVVMLTERLTATRDEVKGVREDFRGLDARVRALESSGVRPASGKR